MKRLRFTAEAESDLDAAYGWYLTQEPDRADGFLEAVAVCIAAIRRHPEAYQTIDATMRRALLRRFPYALFYEVGRTEIVVFAVFHAARNPTAWKRRRRR